MVNKKVAMLPHAPSPPFLLGGVAVLQVASWRVNLEKVWPCGWSTRRYTFNKTSNNWWLYYSYISLLGLSKGNAQVEIPASFFFRSVANRSQVLITHAQPFDSNACAMFWVVSTWHSVMADDEKLSRCKISKDTVYNTLKTHTKYAHIVRGKATMPSVFGTGRSANLMRDLFMSEHLWVNLSSRNMLYQLSYLMLIERSIDANLIVYVDVIVNQAEYQYEVWKG